MKVIVKTGDVEGARKFITFFHEKCGLEKYKYDLFMRTIGEDSDTKGVVLDDTILVEECKKLRWYAVRHELPDEVTEIEVLKNDDC